MRAGDIEDITTRDILDALEVIQTVCYNNTCVSCPFGGESCHIKYPDPEQWEIDVNTIWRAFK